jgi:hypothetical protein
MAIKLGLRLTAAGETEFVTAVAERRSVDFAQAALGDANGAWYEVTGEETALLNECARIPLLSITNDSEHPNRIICDAAVPSDVGGFTIREFGLLSTAGTLLAIGMHQEISLPEPGGTTQFDVVIRGLLDVLASDVVNLVIDPNVVTASRSYVDNEMQEHVDSTDPHPNAAVATWVGKALRIGWLYTQLRLALELFTPDWTLINTADIELVAGVSGDDSIDVVDTTDIKTNEYYVVSDDVGTDFLIYVTEKLSDNRIRISDNLPRTLGAGVVTRCSMPLVNHVAVGVVGNIWLSQPIDVEDDTTGGAVVIRRTLNSGAARLYFRDATHTNWTEVIWSQRRQGDDIPSGYADYEYFVPFQGQSHLRVDIATEDITILHIAALSDPTGLGGFINPAMAPTTPTISAPAAGATGLFERPTLAIAAYSSPGSTAHQHTQFQVSTSSTFATILHDSNNLMAVLTYQLPAGVLVANTTYYIRARVQDDADLWSAWSAISSFATASSFVYIAAPLITSPANDAIDVVEQPTIQSSAFAVVGGTDTHDSSQWQIRTAAGTWAAPLWDSGTDATNKVSRLVPAGVLSAGQTQYYMRVRHHGTTHGWSEYSDEVHITTKQVFASVIGVCQTGITTSWGGSFVYVDQSGATITAPGSTYFNAHAVFGGIQDVTIDGQIMVMIPKFYYKRDVISGGANNGRTAWWISDQPVSGFTIHPAFRNAGADIDQIYIGKYQASSVSTKMKSVAGVLPAVSKDQSVFQAEAAARNTGGVTGFMLWSVFQLAAIQWLYLVENASMASQETTGSGRVNETAAANVDASDVAQATYRGIVGLWGNVQQFVDGFRFDNDPGNIEMWDRDGNKTWVATGHKPTAGFTGYYIYPMLFMSANGTGYDFDEVFIGDTGTGSGTSTTAPDGQYFGGSSVLRIGGCWYDTNKAGLWGFYGGGPWSSSNTNIGARLAKV